MRVEWGLGGGDAAVDWTEAEITADPSRLLRARRVEGPLTLAIEGQPMVVVQDDLFGMALHLCFRSLVALHEEERREVWLYRYLSVPRHLVIVPLGRDRVLLFGENIPRAMFPSAVFWPLLFAAGERFVALAVRAFGPVDPRVAPLQELALQAAGVLKGRGYASAGRASEPPTRPAPAAVVLRCRWIGSMCSTPEPLKAEAYYRRLLGAGADAVRFVGVTAESGAPQWVSTVGVTDPVAAAGRMRAAGGGLIGRLGESELWVDPCGAVIGVGTAEARSGVDAAVGRLLLSPGPARVASFLAESFGWSAQGTAPELRLLDGAEAMATVRRPAPGQLSGWRPVFRVPHPWATAALAVEGGGTVEEMDADPVLVADPYGCRFALTRG